MNGEERCMTAGSDSEIYACAITALSIADFSGINHPRKVRTTNAHVENTLEVIKVLDWVSMCSIQRCL